MSGPVKPRKVRDETKEDNKKEAMPARETILVDGLEGVGRIQ
jgi:hypothetical protein